ncbi:MAG: hypothetical protein KKF65_00515, partial [Nanoarchaeota archaeon]|nr:hypothetical protein [Nanoarchaeota archaeon]
DKNFVLFDKNYTDKFTRATKESMSLRSITICSHGYSLDIIHGFKFTEELFEEKEFKIKPVEHYNLKWIDYRTNSPRKIVTYGSQGPNWSSKGYSIDHTIHNSHHDDTESGIFHLSDILLEVMVLAASVYEYVKDNNELNIHSYYLHDSLKLTLSRMTDEYFTDADLGKNYVNKMKAVKNIQENLDWRNVLDKNIVDSISKSEQIYERFNHVKSRIKR